MYTPTHLLNNQGPCTWNVHFHSSMFCLIGVIFNNYITRFSTWFNFLSPGLMGTCVECGSISLLALLVHLHISPWEWQHRAARRNHSQAGMHSASFHSHHKGLFCRETWTVWMCMYMLTWTENCWDGISVSSVCSLMERGAWMAGAWIAFPPNKQHAGGESKQLMLRAFLKLMWCNPARLLRYDWWENVWDVTWHLLSISLKVSTQKTLEVSEYLSKYNSKTRKRKCASTWNLTLCLFFQDKNLRC